MSKASRFPWVSPDGAVFTLADSEGMRPLPPLGTLQKRPAALAPQFCRRRKNSANGVWLVRSALQLGLESRRAARRGWWRRPGYLAAGRLLGRGKVVKLFL